MNINIAMNMYNLYITFEQCCNSYNNEILDFIFIFCTFTGIFVITIKNPVISIIFLICLFLNIACYLIFIGMSYIGLSYLLVYIGAVSILFLFILMLINIRVSELQSEASNSLALALIFGSFFYYIVSNILPENLFNSFFNIINFNYVNLFFVTSGTWDELLIENLHITSIGNIMYTSHFILLIVTSIILLLAMVGSIIITLKN